MPPPVPPRVKLGRMTAGRPMLASAARASSIEWAMALFGEFDADLGHRVAEFQTVLGAVDDLGAGADQFDVVACQCARLRKLHRGVERGLAAHGRQQRVGLFARDDAFDDLGGDRLDVGGVGQAGVGHDGGGIGVHQDDAIALGLQRLAGLCAGVVELAGLADDDRAGADDQDGGDVGAFGHMLARRRALQFVPCPQPPPARGRGVGTFLPLPLREGVGGEGTDAPAIGARFDTLRRQFQMPVALQRALRQADRFAYQAVAQAGGDGIAEMPGSRVHHR